MIAGRRVRAGLLAALLAAVAVAGCRSPNRGIWSGTFAGSVAGTVEFRIGGTGRELTGTMTGKTRDGQDLRADLEGRVRGEHFYATFAGVGQTGLYPLRFEGFMKGALRDGAGTGDWECELVAAQGDKLSGTWTVEQTGAGEP